MGRGLAFLLEAREVTTLNEREENFYKIRHLVSYLFDFDTHASNRA